MVKCKCQHEWEYFDEHDFPNGYEYDQWDIPHKRCKKCGREYELFDGYGEYANRWRKVEYWSPELHKLKQELTDTKKKLDIAVDALKELSLGNVPSLPDDETLANAMCNYARDTLEQINKKEEK